METEKDWFDEYAENYVAEPIKKIKPLKDNWFGKSEIMSWERHILEEDDIVDLIEDKTGVYSPEYYDIEGFELEGGFFIPEGTPNLYHSNRFEDLFMYDFGDRKVIFCVYEIRNVFEKKGMIILQGWDYNIIIDKESKTIETKYTR